MFRSYANLISVPLSDSDTHRIMLSSIDRRVLVRGWVIVIVLLSMVGGCRKRFSDSLQHIPSASQRLPSPRLEPGSVILKMALVEIKGEKIGELDRVWPLLDSLAIPLDQRKRLDRNGFQVAVLGTQLPSQLVSLLELDPLNMDGVEGSLDKSTAQQLAYRFRYIEHQRLQIKPNEDHWIGCSPPHKGLVWRIQDDVDQRSGICEQARCGFNISVEPQGDGRVRLTLKPELQYGKRRHRFRVSDDAFVVREEPEKLDFQELRLTYGLRLGETLLIASVPGCENLGRDFFVPTSETPQRRFLMIRLLHTQQDDVFTPASGDRPLATSTR